MEAYMKTLLILAAVLVGFSGSVFAGERQGNLSNEQMPGPYRPNSGAPTPNQPAPAPVQPAPSYFIGR